MKKSLFILAVFFGVLLFSCEEQPTPPEQQEREAAIRDSNLKEDAVERVKQKLQMREILRDSLREITSKLYFYQESIADAKTNMQAAKDEVTRIEKSGKSNTDDEDQIKFLNLSITTLEGDIEVDTDKIVHIQENIDKLKKDLQKYN